MKVFKHLQLISKKKTMFANQMFAHFYMSRLSNKDFRTEKPFSGSNFVQSLVSSKKRRQRRLCV